MLKMRQTISVTGESVINDVMVEGYSANIDAENNVQFSSWINDPALYKSNRAEVRADEAAFEDAVYALQDELIAEAEATEE